MLNTHFENQLEKLGYIDMQIAYSLSHCQGDGMAWYGEVSQECLSILMPRLVGDLVTAEEIAKMLKVLNDYRRYEKLSINRNDHRYCHENTMSIDDTVCFSGLIEPEDTVALNGAGVTPDILAHWDEIWSKFIVTLRRDMRKLSRQLRDYGYKLIECASREDKVVRVYTTQNFTVRFKEKETDLDAITEWFDDDLALALIEDMLNGKTKYVVLKAEVIENLHNTVISSELIDGIFVPEGSKHYGGYQRSLLKDAVASARSYIKDVTCAFGCIKAA